jgi:hypothetical protein
MVLVDMEAEACLCSDHTRALPWLNLLESQSLNVICMLVESMRHGKITKCVMMHAAVPVTLPLQNHFPVLTHLTTEAVLCMPQYLPSDKRPLVRWLDFQQLPGSC